MVFRFGIKQGRQQKQAALDLKQILTLHRLITFAGIACLSVQLYIILPYE